MRAFARTAAHIAAAVAQRAPAGASAGGDSVKIRTADQGRALATGQVSVRVRASAPARVKLTASATSPRAT